MRRSSRSRSVSYFLLLTLFLCSLRSLSPLSPPQFFNLLFKYFPTIYDIKYMASLIDGFWGGLQKTADDLGAKRIGPEHQAGSDAMLTMSTYFAMAKSKFKDEKTGEINAKKYKVGGGERKELFVWVAS